jgi:hypothetical protein
VKTRSTRSKTNEDRRLLKNIAGFFFSFSHRGPFAVACFWYIDARAVLKPGTRAPGSCPTIALHVVAKSEREVMFQRVTAVRALSKALACCVLGAGLLVALPSFSAPAQAASSLTLAQATQQKQDSSSYRSSRGTRKLIALAVAGVVGVGGWIVNKIRGEDD